MATHRTVEVAERIMLSAQRDMWALADAVLEDVPDTGHGGDRKSDQVPAAGALIGDQLDRLAVQLDRLGITKADGSPYQPGYLRDVRQVAMAWQADERQTEASFDAHRENAGGGSRHVFLALCAHARGEHVEVPEDVEPSAWKAALDKIATRRHGWKVQTQAVRTAMQREPKNAPTKLDRATFFELTSHLSVGLDGLIAFGDQITEYEIDDEQRTMLLKVLVQLRDRAALTIEALATVVDDEALHELMDGVE